MSSDLRGWSRRTALWTLAAGGGGAILAACGEAGGPAAGGSQGTPGAGAKAAEIHVNFRQGSDAEWQQRLIPQFEAKNPNIKVILDVLPAEPEYWAKIQAQHATKSVADVIWASVGNLHNFANRGLLAEFDPLIKGDNYDLGDYVPNGGPQDALASNGKLYAMPWGGHPGGRRDPLQHRHAGGGGVKTAGRHLDLRHAAGTPSRRRPKRRSAGGLIHSALSAGRRQFPGSQRLRRRPRRRLHVAGRQGTDDGARRSSRPA